MYKIIAQGVGILAMIFNIVSYQGKRQSSVIALQLIGGALFATSFLMLGQWVGGLLNIIATVRAVLFLFKDKLHCDRIPWLIGFIASYIAVYVLNFTLFKVEPTLINFLFEVLPVIGMTALSLGFMRRDAAAIRRFGLISSPAWLIYNIRAGAIGAILCEAFTLTSIAIGMLRHDRKKDIG